MSHGFLCGGRGGRGNRKSARWIAARGLMVFEGLRRRVWSSCIRGWWGGAENGLVEERGVGGSLEAEAKESRMICRRLVFGGAKERR